MLARWSLVTFLHIDHLQDMFGFFVLNQQSKKNRVILFLSEWLQSIHKYKFSKFSLMIMPLKMFLLLLFSLSLQLWSFTYYISLLCKKSLSRSRSGGANCLYNLECYFFSIHHLLFVHFLLMHKQGQLSQTRNKNNTTRE